MSSGNKNKVPQHGEILFPKEVVDRAIGTAALIMAERYAELDPLYIAMMKGGGPFAYDVMRELATLDPSLHPELDIVIMTTYGSGQVARTPRIITDVGPDTIVKDRMVVGLDDISDSGSTFNLFRNHMLNKGAAEVEQAVLIDREIPKNMTPHIAALKTKSLKWLTGKGLDDKGVRHEANRQLPYVAIALTQAKEG